MDILPGIETWLQTQISAITLITEQTCGAFADAMPQGKKDIGVVYSYRSGQTPTAIDGSPACTRCVYIIKVVGPFGQAAQIQDLAGLLYNALNKGKGEAGGVSISECVREQPVQYTETTAQGERFLHAGGLYRIWAEAN